MSLQVARLLTAAAAATLLPAGARAQPTILDEVPSALRVGPSGRPLDAAQKTALLSGKILVDRVPAQDAEVKETVAVAIADSGPDAVLHTLRDFAHFPEYMPYVTSATVDSHARKEWIVTIRARVADARRTYQLRITDDKEKVDGRDVFVSSAAYTGQGDIKGSRGSWTLVPMVAGTKTFLVYRGWLDPGPRKDARPDAADRAAATVSATVDAVRRRAAAHR